MMSDSDLRSAVRTAVTEPHVPTLRGYAERMASLAVREGSSEPAVLGLTALALAMEVETLDVRDSLLILPLLYDALVRVGAAPEKTFEEVAELDLGRGSDLVRAFFRRAPENRSITSMGYRVGSDSDGFRYERTW
jgi:hypothetical protein